MHVGMLLNCLACSGAGPASLLAAWNEDRMPKIIRIIRDGVLPLHHATDQLPGGREAAAVRAICSPEAKVSLFGNLQRMGSKMSCKGMHISCVRPPPWVMTMKQKALGCLLGLLAACTAGHLEL